MNPIHCLLLPQSSLSCKIKFWVILYYIQTATSTSFYLNIFSTRWNIHWISYYISCHQRNQLLYLIIQKKLNKPFDISTDRSLEDTITSCCHILDKCRMNCRCKTANKYFYKKHNTACLLNNYYKNFMKLERWDYRCLS